MLNIKRFLILLCFFTATLLHFTTVSAADSDDEGGLTKRFATSVSLQDSKSDSEGEEESIHVPLTVMPSPTPGFSDKVSVSFLGNWSEYENRNAGKSRDEGYQFMITKMSDEVNSLIYQGWRGQKNKYNGLSFNYCYFDTALLSDVGKMLSTLSIDNPTINFHQCTFLTKGLLGYLKNNIHALRGHLQCKDVFKSKMAKKSQLKIDK